MKEYRSPPKYLTPSLQKAQHSVTLLQIPATSRDFTFIG